MLICHLSDEQEQFLQGNSSRVGENYFIPYWFRRIEGSKYEMIPLGKLPESMKDEINEVRRQSNRRSIFSKPLTPEDLKKEIEKPLPNFTLPKIKQEGGE